MSAQSPRQFRLPAAAENAVPAAEYAPALAIPGPDWPSAILLAPPAGGNADPAPPAATERLQQSRRLPRSTVPPDEMAALQTAALCPCERPLHPAADCGTSANRAGRPDHPPPAPQPPAASHAAAVPSAQHASRFHHWPAPGITADRRPARLPANQADTHRPPGSTAEHPSAASTSPRRPQHPDTAEKC